MSNASADAARGHWLSRFGFLMAAIGSAVGLGNFWRFPYLTGENGGGAFVLLYLASVIGIVLPLLVAEFVIGRRAQTSAIRGVARVASESGAPILWGLMPAIGILGTFLILTFYSVIGGWVLAYIGMATQGVFTGADSATVGQLFDAMLADPERLIVNHAIFMGLTVLIVILGVNNGLETVNSVLMPALFLMLVGLVIYAALYGDFARATAFLYTPEWREVNWASARDANSKGYFSVGISGALMVTYAGYAKHDLNLGGSALLIALADTLIALLAGLAIFPIVFSHGMDPGQGPGLTFVTLPIALGDLPGATIAATAFFVLLLFAAITSSISLLELPVAEAAERGLPRIAGALIFGGVCFAIGIGSVYSFNSWAEFYPFSFVPGLEKASIFDSLDAATSKIMLPLASILVALFSGYAMKWTIATEELRWTSAAALNLLRVMLMVVCPVVLVVVMIANLGVF